MIRDYVQEHLNGNLLPVYGTDILAIPALVGYYSDISHLERVLIYTTIMNEHFNLGDRLDKEAVLRSIEAIGEALTVHVSEVSKKMFKGVDLECQMLGIIWTISMEIYVNIKLLTKKAVQSG